jgi:hypothetical protein
MALTAAQLLALDYAFFGSPFVQLGTVSGLDTAFFGVPFSATASAIIDGTATTSQGQTSDAAGAVTSSGTATTSQGQSADAAGDVLTPGGFTFQGQTSDAVGAVASSGTGDTAQGQSAAAAGTVASTGTGDTAQGQSAAATGSAVTLWTIVNSAIDLQDDPDGDNTANFAFTNNQLLPGLGTTTTGNGIVVLVAGSWRTDATPTITVTDNAGNTYTPGTLQVNGSLSGTFVRQWMQAFYCANATGNANLIPKFDVTQGGSATVFDIPSRMHIAAFEVQSDLPLMLDVEAYKFTTSSSTSITTDAFDTTAAGAIFAIELNFLEDSFSASTVNFESDYTDLVRPKRLASTGDTTTVWGAAGYRVTGSALTGEQTTFTGNATLVRNLLAVGFKSVPATVSGSGDTAQGQSTQAIGGTGWSGPVDTAQGQSTDAIGSVLDVTYTALTGVAGSGAAGAVGVTHRQPVTGISATGATGTLATSRSRALGGVAGSGSPGGVAVGTRQVATTGVTATGSAGNLTVRRTRALTGTAGAGQLATIFAKLQPPLTGVQAAGALGTVTPPSGLSGRQATGSVGRVGTRISKALTGVEATGQTGTLGTTSSTRLSGISSAANVGSVSSSRAREVSGVSGATYVGDILPSQKAAGVASSGAVGAVGQVRTIGLTGVQAASAAGRVGNVAPVNSSAVFVSTPPMEVTTSVVTADVDIVSSAVTVLINPQDEQVLV